MTWRFSEGLDWMNKAACVGMEGDAFFAGPRGGRPATRMLPCTRCLVRSECHEYAVGLGPGTSGIWGGRSVGSADGADGAPRSPAKAGSAGEGTGRARGLN